MKNILSYTFSDIMSYWDILGKYPTEIVYFILIAILLITLSIMTMMILYARRWYLVLREQRHATLRFRYQYFIYDALVESSKEEVLSSTTLIVNKFKKNELKNREQKQLMIDLLIELKKSFSGDAKRQFQQLYVCLGLQQESIAKLKSKHILQKIKGVRELSEIGCHCPELEKAFVEWQTVPQTLLADEVKLAAVRMSSPHMLSFLPQQQSTISEWLQIQLRYHLEALPPEAIPNFSRWLNVSEPSAIVFILRMMAFFKQNDVLEDIAALLYHLDDEVKAEAVSTLEALEAQQYLSSIFNLLDSNNEWLKIKAIHAIGKLGQVFHANLLKPLLQQQSPGICEAARLATAEIHKGSSSEPKSLYKHTLHNSNIL